MIRTITKAGTEQDRAVNDPTGHQVELVSRKYIPLSASASPREKKNGNPTNGSS
jgi:hypothetical protein